ncbi:MAG: metallophosphoesterase family protein [Candidatus Thorarchaeota archaeon]|jgi:DNA repair exonuclease SbcCD nuclease subunit
MTVRIAHISDTHLGARPRQGVKHNVWGEEMRSRLLENDFYERFAELFDKISEVDPPIDLVIHSGDLYNSPWEHNPSQPPVVAQETAMRVLKGFIDKTGIPVLILEGNHGLYRSLDVSLLDTLKMAVPGLDVATQVDLKRAFRDGIPLSFSYEKLDVFCFPFMDYAVLNSMALLSDFNEWISTKQTPLSSKVSVGVSHGMDIDRSLYTTIFEMGYDYIALGHDHRLHKHSKNAWYAGSPERWRFDEIRHEKGFIVVGLDLGEPPKVKPVYLEFERPIFNEKIDIAPDDTESTVIEKVEAWLEDNGLRCPWEPASASRIRLRLEGKAPRVSGFELTMALETLRAKLLAAESEYNIAQFVWEIRQAETDHSPSAYPEIDSEFLIEDPEEDFRAYLGTLEVDEKYREETLTKIAVEALRISVSRNDEILTLEKLSEGED